MSARWTKDERFVVTLYETAEKSGDILAAFDKYTIGQQCGITPKAVDAICQLLFRANFIKRDEGSLIYLSSNGEALALRLIRETEK